MAIDKFTIQEFENALPVNVYWQREGIDRGEYVYYISVVATIGGVSKPTNKRIVVRSSVGRDGVAADSGQDSIRHWVEYENKGRWWPLTKDEKSYTTRSRGWQRRLQESLSRLWEVALRDSFKGDGDYGKLEFTTSCACESETRVSGPMAHSDTSERCGNGHGMQQAVEYKPSGRDDARSSEAGRDLPALPEHHGSASITQNDGGGNKPSVSRVGKIVDPFEFSDVNATPDGGGAIADTERCGTDDAGATQAVVAASRSANPRQLEAIEADIHTPLRVLAPPGSGKTFLLSHRYAHLLSNSVDPNTILAVTFNKTMADELLARIARENPEIAGLLHYVPPEPAIAQICTIHALCYRMLKIDGDRRSVPDSSGRVKPWQVKKALEDIISELWPIASERPGHAEVQSYIDMAKRAGLDSAHDNEVYDGVEDKFGNEVGRELHQARLRFDKWCRINEVITFADMLFDVDRRLQTDIEFRVMWQNKFQYVMIDEGQDTSGQAMRILTTLAAPQNNITIVGDTDQLLYRFAGATPEENLYDGFERHYPNGKLVLLDTNYRSTVEIVNRYNRLIQKNYQMECSVCGGEGSLFDQQSGDETNCWNCGGAGKLSGPYPGKYFKHVVARPGAPEGAAVTFSFHDGPAEEAQAVAQHIKQLLDSGRSPDDFFVAARTCAQLGYLEGPLVQAGIPYISLNGSSFWTMKHVADVVAYIRLAHNEEDGEAFERVYNIASSWNVYPWGKDKGLYCNHRFLGGEFLKACTDSETRAPSYKWRWAAVKQRSSWRAGVQDLEEFVREVCGILTNDGVQSALNFVIENCYRQYIVASEGITGGDAAENGKLDDLLTIKDIAGQFNDAGAFIAYVARATAAAESARAGDWKGHVVISTVHRLKGLERPIVFGMGWCEGEDKFGAPVGLLPHTYSMRPPSIQGVLPIGGQGRIEDERDVAYVLVSRAQEEVYLSGCAHYRNWTMEPSRFIYEMGLADEKLFETQENNDSDFNEEMEF